MTIIKTCFEGLNRDCRNKYVDPQPDSADPLSKFCPSCREKILTAVAEIRMREYYERAYSYVTH